VLVADGSFARGCNEFTDTDCKADEKPQRILYLKPFRIDTFEVTVARWKACIGGGGCKQPTKTFKTSGAGFTYGEKGREQHPVSGVSWADAVAFCKWAGGRLPTEAEWEKAARGSCKTIAPKSCNGSAFIYPWGDDAASCQRAVLADGGDGCGKKTTWAVGSKPLGKSPYGAHDMAGNVWEWVADWYKADHYAKAKTNDPPGPEVGDKRVLRGGSAFWSDTYLRTSYRSKENPAAAELDIGFRCVYPAK